MLLQSPPECRNRIHSNRSPHCLSYLLSHMGHSVKRFGEMKNYEKFTSFINKLDIKTNFEYGHLSH